MRTFLELPLSCGGTFLVDAADWKTTFPLTLRSGRQVMIRPCDCTWRLSDRPGVKWRYVVATRSDGGHDRKSVVLLHRLLTGAPRGLKVDHRNHITTDNRRDNRRDNLRVCTNAENLANGLKRAGGSRFKGVYRRPRDGRWRAQIGCRGRRFNLGNYGTEEAAARAYNKAAVELFGEFALLNEVEELCPAT